MSPKLCLAVAAAATALGAAAPAGEAPRIGDAGSVFDAAKFDERFGVSREFAKAGVEGGVPARAATPVASTVEPGKDIQAALDAAAKRGKAVVVLAEGVHTIALPLTLPAGVILRGADADKTIIEYGQGTSERDAQAVVMDQVERAGLEDLTLRNAVVFRTDFERYRTQFVSSVPADPGAVTIADSRNCWVQNCRIVCSVTRPICVHKNSSHVTLRDNLVDKAMVKGEEGGAAGCYQIAGARYVLIYNETVRHLRHFSLVGACDYTVIAHCRFGVNVCFSRGSTRNVLIESCTSYLHPYHWWRAVTHYQDAVGPGNYIYKHDAFCRGAANLTKLVPCTPGLYTLRTNSTERPWVYPVAGPPPKHGTLYPVTGAHAEHPDEAKARKRFAAIVPLLRDTQVDDAAAQITDEAVEKLKALAKDLPATTAGYLAAELVVEIAAARTRIAAAKATEDLAASPAGKRLAEARSYMKRFQFGKAIATLEAIIRDYPGTLAAEEAKGELKKLK